MQSFITAVKTNRLPSYFNGVNITRRQTDTVYTSGASITNYGNGTAFILPFRTVTKARASPWWLWLKGTCLPQVCNNHFRMNLAPLTLPRMYGSCLEKGENYHCVEKLLLHFCPSYRLLAQPHAAGPRSGCSFTARSAWEYVRLGGPWEWVGKEKGAIWALFCLLRTERAEKLNRELSVNL